MRAGWQQGSAQQNNCRQQNSQFEPRANQQQQRKKPARNMPQKIHFSSPPNTNFKPA
jgi:hypothetical protein